MNEFLEQLSSKQFKEIEKFFETILKLSHTVKVKNPNTESDNEILFGGTERFFRVSMLHEDLESYFKTNFALIQHHKYSLTEIENMIPWERSLSHILNDNILKKKIPKAQQSGLNGPLASAHWEC